MSEERTEDEKQFFRSVANGNVVLLRQILEENPAFAIKFKSYPSLLSYAFLNEESRFEIVKLLAEHGCDVNAYTKGSLSPLSNAISESCFEIAECLLEHGANPNLERELISALNCHDESLRLPFVKLLVEHGADVNQQFELYDTKSHFTALDWATDPEIAEYLKSKGAKTSSELQGIAPEKLQAARAELARQKTLREELIAYFAQKFGPVNEETLVESLPSGNVVEIHIIPPSGDRQHYTLFTWSLSATPMKVPPGEDRWALAELYIQLPGDWRLDQLHDPRWKWPVEWLVKIANYPYENGTWLGGGFTIIDNGDPPLPLGPNTGFSCWMLYAAHAFERSDGRTVPIYRVTPIYREERDLERQEGFPALMRAFDRNSVPFIVDPNRSNVGAAAG